MVRRCCAGSGARSRHDSLVRCARIDYRPRVPDDRDAPTSDDASLVARIVSERDRARAEAELCAQYERRVYLFGLKHLRDAAAAEDLVQDVLATVIARVREGAVRDAEKLGGFVLGTARMHVTNRVRTETRRSKLLAVYGDPRASDAELEPAAKAELERVGGCLAALGERERTVLLLSFYAELDAVAIGGELGLAPGNVRVIRHRALARLQACVGGEGST